MTREDSAAPQTNRVERPGPEVFDDDVGLRQQLFQDGLALRPFEIEGDASLLRLMLRK